MRLSLVLAGALLLAGLPSTATAAAPTVSGLSILEGYGVGAMTAPDLSLYPVTRWPDTGPIEGLQAVVYPSVAAVSVVSLSAATGGSLGVGVYHTDSSAAGSPTITVASNCPTDGTFEIRELELQGNAITRLAVDWDVTCMGGDTRSAGEYRLNSHVALDGPDLVLPDGNATTIAFGEVVGGTTSPAQVATFRNRGTTTLTLGQVTLAGGTPEQFTISADACSGVAMAPGAACNFAVRATPSTDGGWTYSRLVIPIATPALTLGTVNLYVVGLIPTTTTITVPDTVMASYPVDMTADVTPHVPAVTDHGGVDWTIDDVPGGWQVRLTPGQHVVHAQFTGWEWQGGSKAAPSEDTKSITALVATSMRLTATMPDVVPEGTAVGFTATLYLDAQPDSGNLVIRNTTTDTVLGTKPAAAGINVLTVAPVVLPPGSNEIVAAFEGDPDFWPATASITQVETPDDVVAISDVLVSREAIYPAKDDYADTVTFSGQPGEEMTVRIDAISSSDSIVRTWSLGKLDNEFDVTWNGLLANGSKAPADTYTVRMTFVDWKGNTAVVDHALKLSWREVKWLTASITKNGAAVYDTATAGNGKVSKSGSAYANGIKLTGGTNSNSYAAALWVFNLKDALDYKSVSISVLGRGTRSGSKAVLAFMTAQYGRLVGPDYRWWTRKGDVSRDVNDGEVGAVVSANGPMPGAFDVAKARVTYTYAVWR